MTVAMAAKPEPEVLDCTLVLYRSGAADYQLHWLSYTKLGDPPPIFRVVEIIPGD